MNRYSKLSEFLSTTIDEKPIEDELLWNLIHRIVKDKYNATPQDYYKSLAYTIRDRLARKWLLTQQQHHIKDARRIYYFSIEYLIGRLLISSINNLNLMPALKSLTQKSGINLHMLEDLEPESSLGNGGLGRLAACFMDSIATKDIPCFGYGIRYDYGLFKQKISDGYQVEKADKWLADGNPWEIERSERYIVNFYGDIVVDNGKHKWINTNIVYAIPYDIPIPGFSNETVNTLRLWSAKSDDEFRFHIFNNGDYVNAYTEKINDENITKILYPNDSNYEGRELRLKQEYFFSSASLQDILRRYKSDNIHPIEKLADKVVIQLNDTHPTISIPELLRLLVDEERFDIESAWEVAKKIFAYTNHTIMPEALEAWPADMFKNLLPRHYELIEYINTKLINDIKSKYGEDHHRINRMSIFKEGTPKQIKMANLAITGSFSVNGVSNLHTELIKSKLFHDFYELYPEKFNNKTNGITPRRWLYACNHSLSSLITEYIGTDWIINLEKLKKLTTKTGNDEFLDQWRKAKLKNKIKLSKYINECTSIAFDPESLVDIQAKRIHQYKRQILNVLHILYLYLKIKNNEPQQVPITKIFCGKAAPSYQMAKLHIKLINNIASIINKDEKVNQWLKVFFLENYNVSLAEKIIPGCELSEQISTAGYEASGTGNMKFALNGALTIGTLDGANIEMSEKIGIDNMFIFGNRASEIELLKENNYKPQEYIEKSPILKEILNLINNGFFSPSQKDLFKPVYDTLVYSDPFFVLADFENYIKTQEKVLYEFQNCRDWARKSIMNVANMGFFSSDRTIEQYNKDIWKIKPIAIKNTRN